MLPPLVGSSLCCIDSQGEEEKAREGKGVWEIPEAAESLVGASGLHEPM